MMRRIIFLFLICLSQAFSCALCQLMIPSAHVYIDFKTDKEKINSAHIKWEFSENFTQSLIQSYDNNLNATLDKEELEEIKSIFKDYLITNNFLTYISFYDKSDDAKNLPIQPMLDKIYLKNHEIYVEFDIPLFLPIKEHRTIKLEFTDKDGFFEFRVLGLNDSSKSLFLSNDYLNFGFYTISFDEEKLAKEKEKKPLEIAKTTLKQPSDNFFVKYTKYFFDKIKSLIYSGNSLINLFNLCFISLIYGCFHALGPGHGKTLSGTYFLTSKKSVLNAVYFSLRFGFFHVAGAAVLVFLSLYILESFITTTTQQASFLTTKFAGVIIMALAIWMLYTKNKPCSCSHCQSIKASKNNSLLNVNVATKGNFNFSANKISKHTKKDDYFLSFFAGIIPCPGTIFVFVVSFGVGNYFAAFLSAIFMAVGMGIVVFIFAIFGQKIHKLSSNKFQDKLKYIEIFASVFLFILGAFTFLNANLFI